MAEFAGGAGAIPRIGTKESLGNSERQWNKLRVDLLPFRPTRQPEIYAALVIGFLRSGQIEIRERNLLCALRREIPQRLAYDGVVLYFFLVLIAENKHRSRPRFRILLGSRRSRRHGSRIVILISAFWRGPQRNSLLLHLVC